MTQQAGHDSSGLDPDEPVTDVDVDAFQTDGVTLLRGVFSDWVAMLRAGVEANMAKPSWRERTYRPADGSAPFFQDYCNWSLIPEYREFVERSPVAVIAARLMRSRTARIFHDHILVKEPGNSVVTPWHQDQPYYCVTGTQTASFWIPLDPVTRDVTIEYVTGSHRWGRDFRPQRFDGSDLYAGDDTETVPDIDANRENLPIAGWAVEPGDAVAFQFQVIHGAPANRSARRRRVISLRFVGDDATFADRPGPTSPYFPDLVIRPGEPFDAPEFPVIHPPRAAGR